MATSHEAVAATAARDPDLLRNVLITRTIYTLKDSDDPEDFEALNGVTGEIPLCLSWHETLFWLDADDTTSLHDGTTVLVTSDGYRYKASTLDLRIKAVLDRDLTAPPGSPNLGDAYLVKTGATGAWAGHDGDLGIYSARGWIFRQPQIGDWILVEDEDLYIRYTSAGVWLAGQGARTYDANSIPVSALINGGGIVRVENQTTNTPPGSPTVPVAYIIGSSPTGAWAGNAGKIAVCEAASSWTYYTPGNGWFAYDKSLNALYRHNGSGWIASAGSWIQVASVFTEAAASPGAVNTTSAYVYSATTPPTTSQFRVIDPVGKAVAASRASTGSSDLNLRIRYQCSVDAYSNGGGTNLVTNVDCAGVVALYRDSESNAIAHVRIPHHYMRKIVDAFVLANVSVDVFTEPDQITVEFLVAAPNTSSHTYTVAIFPAIANQGTADLGRYASTISRRLLTIEEKA